VARPEPLGGRALSGVAGTAKPGLSLMLSSISHSLAETRLIAASRFRFTGNPPLSTALHPTEPSGFRPEHVCPSVSLQLKPPFEASFQTLVSAYSTPRSEIQVALKKIRSGPQLYASTVAYMIVQVRESLNHRQEKNCEIGAIDVLSPRQQRTMWSRGSLWDDGAMVLRAAVGNLTVRSAVGPSTNGRPGRRDSGRV
jgi:hypothetical protein